MVYKNGNKYEVQKPLMAKGKNDEKPRLYVFKEIYEGSPMDAQYPASLELVKLKKDKKIKRGEKHGSNKI